MLIVALKIILVVAFATGIAVLAVRGEPGTQEWSGLAIVLVFFTPLLAFLGRDVVRLSEWLFARAKGHAYRTEERVYHFGYVQIRMLMAGPAPRFAAKDVGRALAIAKVDDEARKLDIVEWEEMGRRRELYLSETAVLELIDLSRDPDRQHFKVWFTREVMSPLHRERERQQEERKAKAHKASQLKRPK